MKSLERYVFDDAGLPALYDTVENTFETCRYCAQLKGPDSRQALCHNHDEVLRKIVRHIYAPNYFTVKARA